MIDNMRWEKRRENEYLKLQTELLLQFHQINPIKKERRDRRDERTDEMREEKRREYRYHKIHPLLLPQLVLIFDQINQIAIIYF